MVKKWRKELKSVGPPSALVYMVGNKVDLDHQRQVDSLVARDFANDEQIVSFIETSSKYGENIPKLFEDIAIGLLSLSQSS